MLDRLRIVTVTYNSAAVIDAFLDSVPEGADVVVVDNASSDDTCARVARSGSRLISLERNFGFGIACNAGAHGNTREFVFFVNPDAKLMPDCCEKLVAAADVHPEASAFNPAVLNEKGAVRLNRRSALVPRKDWTDPALGGRDNEASVEVNILHGAAFFCRQKAFEDVGGFDERIFLYHEDDELSLRLRQAGGKLRLEHAAKVIHLGGKSSGSSIEAAAFKARCIAQSRMYVEQKHGISMPGARAMYRAVVKILSPLVLLSARKRAQAFCYFKGVRSFDMETYGKFPGPKS